MSTLLFDLKVKGKSVGEIHRDQTYKFIGEEMTFTVDNSEHIVIGHTSNGEFQWTFNDFWLETKHGKEVPVKI